MNSTLPAAVCVAMLAVLAAGCSGGSSGAGSTAAAEVKGDPVRGEQLYQQCAACHSLPANAAGPRHCQLFGRAAGTVPDFEYSQAMRDSGLVWDVRTLDEFLTSPITYVSGTMMGFAGFSDAADRADVIAYLHRANNDPATCPAG
ncbi:c-type cytochrome [Steroidobacter cummioxidans]|uniref:c-type cytochrome n=1 Tax=Steroidobacter cummioxidans TaxID=1803913 RepID=UPI000E31A632|nr:c-type cytochrome [Steroidobacter cummioxidans]